MASLPDVFSDKRDKANRDQDSLVEDLYSQIGQLTVEVNWLKKNLPYSLASKRAMIDRSDNQLSLRRQCLLLGISRSGLYYKPVGLSEETVKLMHAIDEEYTRHPFRGSRGMRDHLIKQGFSVGRHQVRKLYQLMGIQSVSPGPHTSQPNKQHPVFPYLLRELDITHAHQVLSTDITYIRLTKGFIYLVAIIDWYSRYVLDWEVSITLEADFCIEVVDRIVTPDLREIFNTDQGAQFTQPLLDNGIAVSMDGKSRALDNVFIERLWRSLKYECIYLHQLDTVRQAKTAIQNYFMFYNYQRGHQSLNYQTPYQVHYQSLVQQGRFHLVDQLSRARLAPKRNASLLTTNQPNEMMISMPKELVLTER